VLWRSTPDGWYNGAFSLSDIFYCLKSKGKHPRALFSVLSLSQIAGTLTAAAAKILNEFQLIAKFVPADIFNYLLLLYILILLLLQIHLTQLKIANYFIARLDFSGAERKNGAIHLF
jgi:hypothetical protein